MNDDERWAQELESHLRRLAQGDGDAEKVLDGLDDSAEVLRPLVALAVGLRAMERIPGPTAEFRSRLAADLARAPLPSRSVTTASNEAPTTEALVRSLEACLTRIGAEGADSAVVLADFPDLADELRPLLATALELTALGPIEGPASAFRARLAAEVGAAPTPRSLRAQPTLGLATLRRLWRSTAVSAAAAATVVLLLFFGAVYASADAQPGSWLYPFKRGAESARLLVVPGDEALWLHLGYAERRLDEALAKRAHAGWMLADFSREVTAALAEADEGLMAGAPRERLAPPMLAWLFGARVHLVEGRAQLPPTAWRGSMALVDEAIRAMQGDQLAVAPVPRLTDSGIALRSVAPVSRGADRAVRLRRPGGVGAADAGRQRVDATDGGGLVYIIVPPAAESSSAAAPPGPTSAPPQRPRPLPTRPPEATPTSPPSRDPTASPTTQPSVAPSPGPTQTAPMTDPPTALPSLTPTDVPVTPTVPVFNKPPVIDQVFCDTQRLLLGKSTMCHVVAYDPEGAELFFEWSSDVPEMLNRTYKDATYFAAWGASGGVMSVRITVHVSDSADADPDAAGVTMAETYIEVYPPDAQFQ